MCIQRTQRDLNLCSLINSSDSLSIRASGIPKPSPIEVLTRYASPSFSITYSVNTISKLVSPTSNDITWQELVYPGCYNWQWHISSDIDHCISSQYGCLLRYLCNRRAGAALSGFFFFLVSEICFSWCSIFSLVWLR